ncbi:MAG: arginine--tRNA ligase [Deltaproteobacteria bacterium]|nr:arginine--tRNA ligase [Deltaproteobacteria bacterium]MBW2128644.1 arginine--tRNA ligase [Deltaproteobacteria bacterium]
MKSTLDRLLKETLKKCFQDGSLKETPVPDYVIEVPNRPDHGHFATNLPMTLASSQGRAPRDIAAVLVEHLPEGGGFVERTEIAGPGFLNFWIKKGAWYKVLARIIEQGKEYGRSNLGKGEKIMIEFVSANPTGPLHLGHGRGAALGDTLCRILDFTGFDVGREFYINDAGNQVKLLGESIYSRWRQEAEPEYPFPENGYHGEYVSDLAREIAAEVDLSVMDREEAVALCADRGKEKILAEIRRDLADFRIHFDVWFSESRLYASGLLEQTLETAKRNGQLYEEDGALWIKTSLFGDDKDRVVRKQDGEYTYFATDIAYHLDKYRRGFTRAVNIWGADHHGYVQRMKAALVSHGIDRDWLSVLLVQLVKLWKEGREIKMSKRAGRYVSLREVMDEVGVDAARFAFLTKNHDSPIDFDVDLFKKTDSENPVYYIQYAHARISSIFRKAAVEGLSLPSNPDDILERLVLEEELALIRILEEFPSLLEEISRSLEPHRLTYYLKELAASFHKYFNLGTRTPENRIVNPVDPVLSRARLFLAEAVRIVLYNGLNLLGVHAPERM